eukprot:TRINITY_DN14823_c0_g1_i1.p1 TRINITY_DN14823_c0_g1~~TRINITY_DN14823_c0_g1_i1.p1  ORF type:complete len:169 (+),score=48.69 TRINITY_DN14823_c0_g1_i1:59-565(+)
MPVQKEILREGKGKRVESGDTVTLHYVGTLAKNGKKFDSSYDKGRPFTVQIGVGHVIQGWDVAVPTMRVGEKARLHIPAIMAYGTQERAKIPACSDLVFEVEMLEITDSVRRHQTELDRLEKQIQKHRQRRLEERNRRDMEIAAKRQRKADALAAAKAAAEASQAAEC